MIGVNRENEKPCDGTEEVVPSSIQTNEFGGIQLSNITVESNTCPSTPCPVLTPGECGMPSDEALEGGYNSDGNIWLLLSADVEY